MTKPLDGMNLPSEVGQRIIRNAKNGCFAEGLIVQPVPLNSTVEVNGKPFQIEGITSP
jgi:hypothetical protein